MTVEDNAAISDMQDLDQSLEMELEQLHVELACLTHREMIRKEEIRKRCEAIGKERLRLFMERRKIKMKYES